MNRTIWMLWLQGRDLAPPLVMRCIESWEQKNPGWELRCLDATTVKRYVDLDAYVDLTRQSVTAASLSDVIRIALLHEYGGVWADATTICNRPLDDWLPDALSAGVFGFALKLGSDRPWSSWFLAAHPGNRLISKWASRVRDYWRSRESSDDYFWFHHELHDLIELDANARNEWRSVPRISADGPHSIQFKIGMGSPAETSAKEVDWTIPLFKLSYRIDDALLQPGTLLSYLLERCSRLTVTKEPIEGPVTRSTPPTQIASLKVSTENLGDHMQILAGQRLLSALGLKPTVFIDRDNEILSAPSLGDDDAHVPIILNGWHKNNGKEWPPNEKLDPVFIGFHIRPNRCPELLSPESLNYFRRYAPIGCRDDFTMGLLKSHGVESYVSNCLTLTFPKRSEQPATQTETFVVSRDDSILRHLPESLGPITFVSHYSGSDDFEKNMHSATELLHLYRDKAKLIVTTLLHCALPAIAMGIPVVVFYPEGKKRRSSDEERFSTLSQLVRVFDVEEAENVDWTGRTVEIGVTKQAIIERFVAETKKWGWTAVQPIGPIAPSSILGEPTTKPWRDKRKERTKLANEAQGRLLKAAEKDSNPG